VDSEGRRIATGRNDGSVWIVALDGGEEARLFSGHRGTIYDLEIHPDGHQVATASRDDTARLWSLEPGGGSVVLRGHEGSVYGLSYHPRGHLLATAAFDGTVGLWRTDPGEGITETGPLAQLPASRHTTDIDFDPTGRLLAVASDEAVIRIWRFDETTLAFDGDPVVLDGGCRHAALPTFTPDGRWLAVSVDSGTVQLWDVERALAGDPDPAKIFDLHEGPISAMAFDSEGRRLITSGWDNLARVVSLEGDRKILDLDQGSLLGSVVFLPQGDQVATASKEGIRIWRLVDDVRGTLRAATEACLPWRVREKHLLEERSEARARFRECERRHGRLP
jgi:WD40 repeat protein